MPVTSLGRTRLPLYLLLFFDLSIAFFSASLAGFFRFDDLEFAWPYPRLIAIQALLAIMFSFVHGVYLPWRGRPLGERLWAVIVSWSLSFAVLTVFLWATKTSSDYSRLWLGVWFVTAMVAAILGRYGLYLLLNVARSRGRNSKRILVVGSGTNFKKILDEFTEGNPYGFRLDKVIDFTNPEDTVAQVQELLDQNEHYDECWVCLPLKDSGFIHTMVHTLRHSTIDIRFMPGMRDMPLLNHKVTPIGGFYSLDISCTPMDGYNRIAKAIEDRVIGGLIFLMILPVCGAIALAVRLSSPGPILFKQYRHGADGKPIKVYKFRSMKIHAEEQGTVTQATKGDPRITRVGAFIRKTSLDELPQFFNVIQGKMSVVGPRPHALEHNEYYKDLVESYMKRHKVKPGITGLAQVRGFRGETDTLEKMQKRVECDLEYMNNWSVWLDLKIIFFTVFKGFVGKTAY